MIQLLHQPYPYLLNKKRNILIAFLVGALVYLVNQVLSDEKIIKEILHISQNNLSLLFGTITLVSILLTFEVLPKYFISKNTIENWNITKELVLISVLHAFIILFNFSAILVIINDLSSISIFGLFIKISVGVVAVGLLPSSIIVWLNYTIQLKQNLKQVKKHNAKLKESLQYQKSDEQTITIASNVKSETINFKLNQLLFVKSDGNYIELYLKEDNQVKKIIHRALLQTIEKELNKFPHIFRTHRSYLVNCKKITHSEGTARNYQLFFAGVTDSIPVARNQFQAFNKAMQNLKSIHHN